MMRPERRQAPRASERVSVAVTENGAAFRAETNNLSATGAYCTVDRFIAPMTKLQIEYELPNGPRRVRIRCAGVVVRIEPVVEHADRGRYHMAIFFTDLTERDRSVITRFVRERLAERASPP